MSNKRKRSRVVSSIPETQSDNQSASPSADELTTTCTNNNARRLRAERTVTLRTGNTRRQSQRSSHAEVWSTEPTIQTTTQLDGGHATDDIDEDWMDIGAENAENAGEGETTEAPKRSPVCHFWTNYVQILTIECTAPAMSRLAPAPKRVSRRASPSRCFGCE